MSKRLIICNLNNTLRTSTSDPGGFINSTEDQEIITQAGIKLQRLDVTWDLVIVHNEGAITAHNPATKKPFKTEKGAIAEMRDTLRLIKPYKIAKAIYICPNFRGVGKRCLKITVTRITQYEGEGFRLPLPGMLLLAYQQYANTKTTDIIYVGDDESDAEAAELFQQQLPSNVNFTFHWARDWWEL